ncbi:hypothetical protein PMH09_04380 [Roseofilum sp. BLCC_M143]|uniref:Uncharacterized protein n=2 Tax=Roseofilum TaxID=1233426 RepID=A0ABT7BVZ0_9CYAN|nr:hypothetical protein [Roseofilum casamattae BLCC-M143]
MTPQAISTWLALVIAGVASLIVTLWSDSKIWSIDYAVTLIALEIPAFMFYQLSQHGNIENSISSIEESIIRLNQNVNIIEGSIDKVELIGNAKVVEAEEFYSELLEAAKSAKKQLCFSSFMFYDVRLSGVPAMKKYFEAQKDFMNNNNLDIRRVVTIESISKLKWVLEKIIEPNKNIDDFTLRHVPFGLYHRNQKPSKDNFPILLNVQIIDKKKVFIVNPSRGAHYNSDDKSVYIKTINSEAIGTVFKEYYDSLWGKCDTLLEKKEIKVKILQNILDHFESEENLDDYKTCQQKIDSLRAET